LFFLGLMAMLTSIFFPCNSPQLFLCCNDLHYWHKQFCFDPPNNLHPKRKSPSYPYPGMALIFALYIIFSKIYILSRYYMTISLFWYPEIRISFWISKNLISRRFQKWCPKWYPVRISGFLGYPPNTENYLLKSYLLRAFQ
jgi:hypothetical protein